MIKSTGIFILFISASLMAQDFGKEIYDAYISSEMDRWKSVMVRMEADCKQKKDPVLLYELTESQYGYIAYCISVKKKSEAKTYLEKAEKNIDLLLVYDDSWSNVYALQGALFGFRIGMEPLKAPVYGKRSQECNDRALELSPDNPQGWMERANIEFYKPAMFGGSKQRAVPLYEKAVRLYEEDPELIKHNWMYLNCLSALANACAETDRLKQADHLYRLILKVEPDFKWIRDEVYPAFKEKHPGI